MFRSRRNFWAVFVYSSKSTNSNICALFDLQLLHVRISPLEIRLLQVQPAMAAVPMQVPSEFWHLYAIYISKLCKNASSHVIQLQIEERVIPLLERLDFLSQCRDLHALKIILVSLQNVGFQIPDLSKKALCVGLLFDALTRSRDNSVESDLKSCKSVFQFVKLFLGRDFCSFRETVNTALSRINSDSEKASVFQIRLCALEEEICWSICDESQLLQYLMEAEKHAGHNLPDSNYLGRPQNAEERSKLAWYIRCGLQSQEEDTRLQTLKLAVACSFHSPFAFSKLFPFFQTAVYLEDYGIRQYVLAALMDLFYLHHSRLPFNAISHLILPFLYAPTARLQLIAVKGCGAQSLFFFLLL
ncbi:hypothetical protein KP509_09G028700 [Ceratopteris richardii]|uniref:Uncharacterized protein n=1 Tax=Ceratopteris richardii TaxID=49495 RepID=A0A8T2U017_CERRI|nr:hypothetical protein KP509_09G028700 [Ceratopteris richardii]